MIFYIISYCNLNLWPFKIKSGIESMWCKLESTGLCFGWDKIWILFESCLPKTLTLQLEILSITNLIINFLCHLRISPSGSYKHSFCCFALLHHKIEWSHRALLSLFSNGEHWKAILERTAALMLHIKHGRHVRNVPIVKTHHVHISTPNLILNVWFYFWQTHLNIILNLGLKMSLNEHMNL